MNGIGPHSNCDRSCPWRRSRRQHDSSTTWDEHPVPPTRWQKQLRRRRPTSTASRLSIRLERPKKHALDVRQYALQSLYDTQLKPLACSMGIIEASCCSVHERAQRSCPRITRTWKREGRNCTRPQNGQTFHLKGCGFSRMEPGQECPGPKRCRCGTLRLVLMLRISCGLFGSKADSAPSATSHKSWTNWMSHAERTQRTVGLVAVVCWQASV